VGVVHQGVEDLVEETRHAVVQVLRVEGVLLHLLELMVLEQIPKESIMRLFQALQIILKHFIVSIQILDLPQRQLGVQSWVDLVQLKHLQSHLLNV
jgi:hypothetical protein